MGNKDDTSKLIPSKPGAKPRKARPIRRRTRMFALEPRVLFDGALVADIVGEANKGRLTAQEAVFRVLVKPEASTPSANMVIRGTARIETDFRFVAENFIYRAISVLIRESGL